MIEDVWKCYNDILQNFTEEKIIKLLQKQNAEK